MVDQPSAPPSPSAADAVAKFQPKLPPAVQRQVDAVAAMMAGEQPPDNGGGPASPEGAAPPSGGDDPAGAGEPPDGGDEPAGDETWEQRARSMAGRLEQALNANQQMSVRLNELEMQASTARLYGKGPQPAAAPAAPPPPPVLVKPEEVNDYGEEFFDVVGRRAREVYAPEFDALNRRLKQLESGQQAVVEITQKTQKRGLYDTLSAEVPNWREVNHHPDFKLWLSYPDPYSGMKRHDLLNDAFSRHDTNRVVNFFTGFLAEATGLPQNPQGGNPPAPPLPNGHASGVGPGNGAPPLPNGNGSGRPTLEDFAAPGRARSGPQTLPPDKPIYTQAQIAKFSDDKRRGLWRGREAEVQAIEADIFRAQHEGRIQ